MMPSLRVAQRRHGDHGREAAAVLADVGQLVDVLDAARGLEDQRLEPGRDRRPKLEAERLGPRDHLLRIGDVGRRDLVHHLGGRVAEHPLGADVEDLDDALRVGRDAREVGAVEDRALQRPRLQNRRSDGDVGQDGCFGTLLPLVEHRLPLCPSSPSPERNPAFSPHITEGGIHT